MSRKPKKLNPIFIVFIGILINISATVLIPQDQQKIEAQRASQVRTDQWLKVEQVSGNVTYHNLYNYANRNAQVGDRLQTASDAISTGANSSAVLIVDTGVGAIYVTENTTIQIRSFKVAPE